MIELDKSMEPICKAINECYEAMFPSYPKFPKFSITRAMATLWKAKVYSKIEKTTLLDAFIGLLKTERNEETEEGKQQMYYQKYYILNY